MKMIFSDAALNNIGRSTSQQLRIFTHIRHEKTSTTNDIRIECVTK